MILVALLSVVVAVCHGFSYGAQRSIIARRVSVVRSAQVDIPSFLISVMTEDDARNFEIIKLLTPAAIPVVFIAVYTTVLLKVIESNKESTEKSIALNKESMAKSEVQINALIESNKESTEKSIALNKESMEKSIALNKESTEKSIASNKEIAEGQINALRDVTAAQIKAFETKFDKFYSSFSRNNTINTKND